jgi:hypothetical protein
MSVMDRWSGFDSVVSGNEPRPSIAGWFSTTHSDLAFPCFAEARGFDTLSLS